MVYKRYFKIELLVLVFLLIGIILTFVKNNLGDYFLMVGYGLLVYVSIRNLKRGEK